jgi:hypothetical protein
MLPPVAVVTVRIIRIIRMVMTIPIGVVIPVVMIIFIVVLPLVPDIVGLIFPVVPAVIPFRWELIRAFGAAVFATLDSLPIGAGPLFAPYPLSWSIRRELRNPNARRGAQPGARRGA